MSEDLNLSCKSVQHRLATQWGYVKAEQPVHTDHPMRHWDRTCPACVYESDISQERVDETTKDRHEWVGLTKTEFEEAVDGLEDLEDCWQAIEAKLKEKNNA